LKREQEAKKKAQEDAGLQAQVIVFIQCNWRAADSRRQYSAFREEAEARKAEARKAVQEQVKRRNEEKPKRKSKFQLFVRADAALLHPESCLSWDTLAN
jgi:hypothetical protein